MCRQYSVICVVSIVALSCVSSAFADTLPFDWKVETYRSEEGDITAFSLRLEQPFLAEQFEKSNLLRLEPLDEAAYLIYPKETRFTRKHAEFYGRLKGTGVAKLKLSYEVVTEDLAGVPRVDINTTEVEVAIPREPIGIDELYKKWARQQNAYFAELLRYYPDTSFLEFVLLQSKDRYGVQPPAIRKTSSGDKSSIDYGLYHTFSGGLALQQSLQREVLKGERRVGDLSIHVSQLQRPSLDSLAYADLLKGKRDRGIFPAPHPLAAMVPEDQYFLQLSSMTAANQMLDLSREWGESLFRMLTVSATDHHLKEKYEEQLCLNLDSLTQLFADQVVAEFAVTGSDFFFAEGTDLTVLLRLKDSGLFQSAKHPSVLEREVNYRGHRINARYTQDRVVSSFVLLKDDVAIYSNSPVAMRKVIDTLLGESPSLDQAADYQYVTTLLPHSDDPNDAYLYLSEAFLKRLVSPKFKIAQKRRLQAFNNLVMLNNASMFYRLEYGESPDNLSDLVKGKFYDPGRIVDCMGGAFAWDAERDTATSSVFNRIKYLTPIAELDVMKVSSEEQQEYDAYKARYESFWRDYFDPIAVRLHADEASVHLETLVLPFANGSLYRNLQSSLSDAPAQLGTSRIAGSAILSLQAVPGRSHIANFLRVVPGVPEVLESDPTLTDMSWLGDEVSVHYLDDSAILEVDPTRLQRVSSYMEIGVPQQAAASALLAAVNLPVYLAVDVEDEDKASRLLDQLSSRIFLNRSDFYGLPTQFDAYQLPAYKDHKVYVLSYQFYAVKIRLHVALVSGRLVAATRLPGLREAIDAASNPVDEHAPELHAQFRINLRAIDKLQTDLQMYWNEKLREAAHRNIMPIYTLIKLYNVPVDQVNALSDAKYGVSYFCPGGGDYAYDAGSDQVQSTVYGNRQKAKQPLSVNEKTGFSKFLSSVEEITAGIRFQDEGMISIVNVKRSKQ